MSDRKRRALESRPGVEEEKDTGMLVETYGRWVDLSTASIQCYAIPSHDMLCRAIAGEMRSSKQTLLERSRSRNCATSAQRA